MKAALTTRQPPPRPKKGRVLIMPHENGKLQAACRERSYANIYIPGHRKRRMVKGLVLSGAWDCVLNLCCYYDCSVLSTINTAHLALPQFSQCTPNPKASNSSPW